MRGKDIIILGIIFLVCSSYGPPNCNLYKEDKDCYNACKEAEKAIMHSQGSKASQEHFDESIKSCPTFDYSYYEKAVPYAKRGLMREWKEMIDKAVEINPKEHLSNRGWYHFFFMHNYESAIEDIEHLDELVDYDIGHTGDAIYHLNIMKGLCWKGLGQLEKAIAIIEQQIEREDHDIGLYDYLHLGVLYFQNGDFDLALETLEKQIILNDLSEIYYYIALSMKAKNDFEGCRHNLEKSLKYYKEEKSMSNPYRQMVDEIFLIDIENEMTMANKGYDVHGG
jgi:tetratricopeptide (TPR) repeat protein